MTSLDWIDAMTGHADDLIPFSDWLEEEGYADVAVAVRRLPELVWQIKIRLVMPLTSDLTLVLRAAPRLQTWAITEYETAFRDHPSVAVLVSAVASGSNVPWHAAAEWFTRATGWHATKYFSRYHGSGEAQTVHYRIPAA